MCSNDGKVQPGDVSDLMSIMYRDQFVCIAEKPETWYLFNKMKHRWTHTETVAIRKEISNRVYNEFKDVHLIYLNRSTGDDED